MQMGLMKLEVISHSAQHRAHPTPLLFVHGAWHGAWCWQNFLPYFAEHDYQAHALSLRGHGRSEGGEGLRWHGVQDYITDLEQVIATLGTPPVLIAHSLGGYVLQKFFEEHSMPAGVLLASLPTSGILGMLLRMFKRHPVSTLKALLLFNPWYFVSTPALAKDYLFSEDIPDEKFREYYSHIQPELFRVALEAAFLNLPHPRKVTTPLLLLSAADDRVFTVSEQQRTAKAYGTETVLYPNMAHDMMLERGWQSVADRILDWLDARRL